MQRVKLMPEYDCDFPVWIDGSEATPNIIADLDLRNRIHAWNELFLRGFDLERGWLSESDRRRFREQASQLITDLERHFGDSATVTYDLWPLTSDMP